MKQIWKYTIPRGDRIALFTMPVASEFLTTQMQDGKIVLWYLGTPGPVEIARSFEIVGTGWNLDMRITKAAYRGTVQDGELVWHVLEHIL